MKNSVEWIDKQKVVSENGRLTYFLDATYDGIAFSRWKVFHSERLSKLKEQTKPKKDGNNDKANPS